MVLEVVVRTFYWLHTLELINAIKSLADVVKWSCGNCKVGSIRDTQTLMGQFHFKESLHTAKRDASKLDITVE